MKNNKMHTLLDLMLSGVNLELTKEGSEIAWSEIEHRTIKPKKEEIKYTVSSIGADESITVYCAEIDASIYNVLPEHIIVNEVIDMAGEFAHPTFESDLNSFEKSAYDYSIEKTSGAPENWLLTICLDAQEGDIEGAYNYGNLQDLDNDVRMATKHYQIELNKID